MNYHRITKVALCSALVLASAEISWAAGMRHHTTSSQTYDWSAPRDLDTDSLGVDFSRETDPMYGYGVEYNDMRSRRTGSGTMDEPTDIDTDQQGIDAEEEIDW
jgi:hypothetical protein